MARPYVCPGTPTYPTPLLPRPSLASLASSHPALAPPSHALSPPRRRPSRSVPNALRLFSIQDARCLSAGGAPGAAEAPRRPARERTTEHALQSPSASAEGGVRRGWVGRRAEPGEVWRPGRQLKAQRRAFERNSLRAW
eukprot:3236089-Pleurochrysis_carterae.AAC.2